MKSVSQIFNEIKIEDFIFENKEYLEIKYEKRDEIKIKNFISSKSKFLSIHSIKNNKILLEKKVADIYFLL